MKKFLKLVLASVFIFSMSAMAQDQTPPQGPGPGMRQQLSAQVRAENIAKELNLTDGDKVKVQAIYEKNDAIFAKFRADVSRDSPDFREKFKALRDAQDAELVEVIGKEKFEAYQKLQAERRQKMMNNN